MSPLRSRKIRLFGMNASPTVALVFVIPLAVFLMILLMGYQFVSLQTEHESLIHPPNHPLHSIVNPGAVVQKASNSAAVGGNQHDDLLEPVKKENEPPLLQNKKLQSDDSDKTEKTFESIGTDVEYHIVFSTGCTAFQDWQSYVFFYQAMKIKQPGTVTRIVSGCNEKEEATLRKIFQEQIIPMEPNRFKIHFTPDFAKILKPGIDYPYFNKPCGMKHWLETALGFPDNPQNEDAIVVLLDPDQAIMRPFQNNDFSNTAWMHVDPDKVRTQIMHGAPMGQRYGFALQWKEKVRMSYVAPDLPEPSPVDSLSREDANAGYVVGPPYIATARDMYKICDLWCQFAPRVHGASTPPLTISPRQHLLAEMFAYCLAAAHLELHHQTAASFMVSSVGGGRGEGWMYVDKLSDEEVCQPDSIDPEALPNVLHFCQRYGWGPFFFGKRKLPHTFLTCESPLLKEPPATILTDYHEAQFPENVKQFDKRSAKENAFIVCFMIELLNEAATYFKQHHCNANANMEHSMVLSALKK
eukprot:scaffold3410_cov158-Amphora_coffeaeformis.AAC.15